MLCLTAAALPAAGVAAPAPGSPAVAPAFPSRVTVERQLGRRLKFKERIIYRMAERKATRRARRARSSENDGPYAALSVVSFGLAVLGLLLVAGGFTVAIFVGVIGLILAGAAVVTAVISLFKFAGRHSYKRGRGFAIAALALLFGPLLLVALLALLVAVSGDRAG